MQDWPPQWEPLHPNLSTVAAITTQPQVTLHTLCAPTSTNYRFYSLGVMNKAIIPGVTMEKLVPMS